MKSEGELHWQVPLNEPQTDLGDAQITAIVSINQVSEDEAGRVSTNGDHQDI